MKEQIKKNFTYHPPKEGQTERFVDIRNQALLFATVIDGLCPNSREKSLALTKLEEAVFWANASIARN
ncbi:Acb2/Tad1 domain-containing protein [Bacillus cereus]|uniref:Acb2/Tad1 domain-containing protein n=1 Tax=Bacillus cereus TaxID=1396 RepID=UPI0035CB47F0